MFQSILNLVSFSTQYQEENAGSSSQKQQEVKQISNLCKGFKSVSQSGYKANRKVCIWLQQQRKVSYFEKSINFHDFQPQQMKCPHFQKVNFQRIKQVRNEQSTVQDEVHEPMNYSIISLQSLGQQGCNIPDQGIQKVNSFKSKLPNSKYSFNSMSVHADMIRQNTSTQSSKVIVREDSIKQCSTIKMPKQMNIKKMISEQFRIPEISLIQDHEQICFHNYPQNIQNYFSHRAYQQHSPKQSQNQSPQIQNQIPSQHDYSYIRKNPHVLISKTSMMTPDTFEVFSGIVFLQQKQEQPYECQLKQFIVKISREDKIKYYIELLKVNVTVQSVKDSQKSIKMTLQCKNKSDTIKLHFISAFQKQIFTEVYFNCIKKIKSSRKMQKFLEFDKQNLHPSANISKSPLISQESNYVQEESQILNQKNELGQSQSPSSSSLSSLSMNSYEGDSLVFETQRMLFSQVKQMCNTFDILLFKNKSLMSKVQRIFTNSDYDHVAMLLKTATNDLLMLEATSNSGVAIYTFNSLLRVDRSKYFSRIGLRRYTGEKNLSKINRLQHFIRKTVGKKYKFDPMYLIKSQANQQKDTFFCSQLVAEALQDAGILSNQVPSFKYLPKHFGEDGLNSQVIDGKYSDVIILE